MAVLYIFSGLPGAGKSTLAQGLARKMAAVYLRIDTIEQALRDLCGMEVVGEGYEIAYRIAADHLRLDLSVVADSCNPIELTRAAWEKIATEAGARFVNIEVICSDEVEHRRRVETRAGTVPGLSLPTWEEAKGREYEAWSRARIVIDTAGKSEAESLEELRLALEEGGNS